MSEVRKTLKPRFCKDCKAEWEALQEPKAPFDYRPRPAPHPGPRCATHHRAKVKTDRAKIYEQRVQALYGLRSGDYERLYDLQGGTCAICTRATGRTRRLSVDHDHATGAVRGLLCRPCNSMLGHARDDTLFFARAMRYLVEPPARRLS